MANVKKYLDSILTEKKNWDEANKAGNQAAMDTAASNASKAYEWLDRNGYDGVANQLSKSNYTQAQKVADKFVNTSGKTAFRPYMEAMAKDYGISKEDINKDIGYNELTGEVSLGGKNLGKPYAEYDGVSYWDEADLKKAFDSYIATKPRSESQLYMDNANHAAKGNIEQWSQISDDKADMQKKYDELSDYAMANPYDTDEGRAIMSRYNLAGLNARDNAIALGAATNGGNIDSSSAANAMRQQMALVGQGQQAVESMYGTRIDKVNQILQGLGAYNTSVYDAQNANLDRAMTYANSLFNNMETRKMNDDTIKTNEVARQMAISDMTGHAAPYTTALELFNTDGTLKNPELDYTAIKNELQAQLDALPNDGTRTAERSKILQQIDNVQKAINAKIADPSGKWSEWATLYKPTENQRTEAGHEFDAGMEYNYVMNADKLYENGLLTNNANLSGGKTYAIDGVMDGNTYADRIFNSNSNVSGTSSSYNTGMPVSSYSYEAQSTSSPGNSGAIDNNASGSGNRDRVYSVKAPDVSYTQLYQGDENSAALISAVKDYVDTNLGGKATAAEIRDIAGRKAKEYGVSEKQLRIAEDWMLR